MSNLSNLDISHYKVLSLPTQPEPNSVYYLLDSNNNIVKGYITDKQGLLIPLFTSGGGSGVESVTGTGVTGIPSNPKVNISTFVSSQLGNLVHLSSLDGKLIVNPIVSPDNSIEVVSTSTELQVQLASSIQDTINSALQSGDNVSLLNNDGDGTSPFVTQEELNTAIDGVDITTDAIPTDGSTNPVESNGVFDALSLKADDSSVLHKNGDEVKDGSLTLNDTLYLPDFTAAVGEFVNIGVDEFGAVINIPIETTTTGKVLISVTNKTGVSIPKGSSVYINGAQGSRATIALAIGDTNLTTSLVIGLTNETIADNAIGYVVILGEIDKINTSAFSNGDRVYVSPTIAGGLTNIIPVSPNNAMFVGTVTNSHATQGKIVINIVYAVKLDRLIDVAIVTPTNRQLLTYETSTGLWKNSSLLVSDIPQHHTTHEAGGTDVIQGENLSVLVTPPNTHYTAVTDTLKGHLQGIDIALGAAVQTTAGITSRIYFTGDNVTVGAGTFFQTNTTSKGTIASASPPALVNGDNIKQYFTKDILGISQPALITFPQGVYSGQLTVSATPTPNNTQQRFTIEIYKADASGNVIASGITGAPVGSYGQTVIAILDSGITNLTAGFITNITVTGILNSQLTLLTGERVRFRVSAAKIGTGGGNVTMNVYYGTNHNSFYDVPVTFNTDSVLNKSSVGGITTSDALNLLDSKIPVGTAQLVYFNFTDPNSVSATIFDLSNPPTVNNNALKADVKNLYVGTDSSTWVYKTSPAGYTIKPATSLLNQIEVSGNQTAQLYWNGMEITAMTSGLHTIPNTVPAQFSYDVAADVGVIVTWALGVGLTWRVAGLAAGVAPPSMIEGQFCTVSRRIGTNEIRVRGLL
jgi:hypothetical protein